MTTTPDEVAVKGENYVKEEIFEGVTDVKEGVFKQELVVKQELLDQKPDIKQEIITCCTSDLGHLQRNQDGLTVDKEAGNSPLVCEGIDNGQRFNDHN